MNSLAKPQLEVCAATVDDAIAAHEGGADRIELNMALEVGGLTPTIGLYHQVRKHFDGEILCMVRPRSGGFEYSPAEQEIMLLDARALLDAGADGLVFGGLVFGGERESNQIDIPLLRQFRTIAESKLCVFHRAMDIVNDWQQALTVLTDEGIDRVLTSGMAPTAIEGKDRLAQFVEFTKNSSLQIVAGSGVSIDNICQLAAETGCHQFHGTFSKVLPGQTAGPVAIGLERRTQKCLVAEARKRLATKHSASD